MTITTTSLTKAAGMAAATAGAIFIAVQINHPATDSFLTATNQWVVRCTAKAVMCALALAGITGIYLRQVREMRVLGLVGLVLLTAGYAGTGTSSSSSRGWRTSTRSSFRSLRGSDTTTSSRVIGSRRPG